MGYIDNSCSFLILAKSSVLIVLELNFIIAPNVSVTNQNTNYLTTFIMNLTHSGLPLFLERFL